MTYTALLPDWLRVVWLVASSAVAAVHLRHIWTMTGQRRVWHVGHVLMACGMAYMYLPHAPHLIPNGAGTAVFATAACASLAAAVSCRVRDGDVNPLWILITVEMAVMVYMFLPMTVRSPLLNHLLAAYLAATGVGWALGRWDRTHLYEGGVATGHGTTATLPAVPALRASLVTMIGAMAYMLLTM